MSAKMKWLLFSRSPWVSPPSLVTPGSSHITWLRRPARHSNGWNNPWSLQWLVKTFPCVRTRSQGVSLFWTLLKAVVLTFHHFSLQPNVVSRLLKYWRSLKMIYKLTISAFRRSMRHVVFRMSSWGLLLRSFCRTYLIRPASVEVSPSSLKC